MKPLYLDNAATTRMKKEVVKAMLQFLNEKYGNPSSEHVLGEQARKAMNEARALLARELWCKAHEIVFTSGGTEANTLALQGVLGASKKKKVLISAIEHSSVWEVCETLKKEGCEIVEIAVNSEGFVRMSELEKAIDEKTALVSVIHGNNEIGTLQDIGAIATICKRKGVLFHTDAVQSFGKERILVREMGIDLLTASAHKIHGPKGIGLLYVREGIALQPLIPGSQEAGRRGGTENVAGIVGFAKALEMQKRVDTQKVKAMRELLMQGLENLGGTITGSRGQRLWDHVSVAFPEVDAEWLVQRLSLRGIYCSTRSACLTQQKKESRVLKAIGLSKEQQKGALRMVLDESITKKDVERVMKEMQHALKADVSEQEKA